MLDPIVRFSEGVVNLFTAGSHLKAGHRCLLYTSVYGPVNSSSSFFAIPSTVLGSSLFFILVLVF